ncbi:TetR family transcriptional regulator [Paramicrobacterium agarici]|nr:TetR family transcriptional regulator [Microbacterium agarici]
MPRRAGRPAATSRAQILAAARRLIERDGWQRLTIRSLASELGIGATTLYHHVRDRDDLLIQLLNDHASQTQSPPLPDDPGARIVVAGAAIRDTLASWPWAAEVLTTDGFVGRLGGSALWMVEAIVAGATDAGCSRTQAVEVFRHIWFYTVGEILVRSRSRKASASDASGTFFMAIDARTMPHLAAIGNDWPVIAARDSFREGLEAFVDGLLRRYAKREAR